MKPLLHFIVENTIDIDTIQVLKFVLGIGFNTNIQNLDNDNETALHINFKKNSANVCCVVTDLLL